MAELGAMDGQESVWARNNGASGPRTMETRDQECTLESVIAGAEGQPKSVKERHWVDKWWTISDMAFRG